MPVETCPVAVNCECSDFPLLNRTAEQPDSGIWVGECIRCGSDDPPLGDVFERRGCRTWALSTVSQLDADLQAAAQEASCLPGGGGGGDPWVPTPSVPVPGGGGGGDTFFNTAQGVSCASGHNLVAFVALPANLSIDGPTLTVAAGEFSAGNQSAADAAAASYVDAYMTAGLDSGELCCDNIFSDLVWGAPVVTNNGGVFSHTLLDEDFDLEVTAATDTGSGGSDCRIVVVGTFVYTGPQRTATLHLTVDNPNQSAQSRITVSHSVTGQLHSDRYETAGVFAPTFIVPLSAGATITVTLDIFCIGGPSDPGHNHWTGELQTCEDPTP